MITLYAMSIRGEVVLEEIRRLRILPHGARLAIMRGGWDW